METTNQIQIFAFSGAAGSGKDTALRVLKNIWAESHPEVTVSHLPLARKLKIEVARQLLPLVPELLARNYCSDEVLLDWVESNKTSVRSLLQSYGDTCRTFDPDKWIKEWKYLAGLHSDEESSHYVGSGPQTFGVTDIRYPNEIQFFRENYLTFHVHLESTRESILVGEQKKHASESHLSFLREKADSIISNDFEKGREREGLAFLRYNLEISLIEFEKRSLDPASPAEDKPTFREFLESVGELPHMEES